MAECELYGGWLASIKTQAEFNCLQYFGNPSALDAWFWTDGNSKLRLRDTVDSIILGRKDGAGVWIHAADSADQMTWFGQLWNCNPESYVQNGGEGVLFYLGSNKKIQGAYCDQLTDFSSRYICEGLI